MHMPLAQPWVGGHVIWTTPLQSTTLCRSLEQVLSHWGASKLKPPRPFPPPPVLALLLPCVLDPPVICSGAYWLLHAPKATPAVVAARPRARVRGRRRKARGMTISGAG
jgi:hypothetical protein